MHRLCVLAGVTAVAALALGAAAGYAQPITTAGKPAQLDIRSAGEHSVRVTLKPVDFEDEFPFTPALAQRDYPQPALRLRVLAEPVDAQVGRLRVAVRPGLLTVRVSGGDDGDDGDTAFGGRRWGTMGDDGDTALAH